MYRIPISFKLIFKSSNILDDYKSIIIRGNSVKDFRLTKLNQIIGDRLRLLTKVLFIILKFLHLLIKRDKESITCDSIIIDIGNSKDERIRMHREYFVRYFKNEDEKFCFLGDFDQFWPKKKIPFKGILEIASLISRLLLISLVSLIDLFPIKMHWIANAYDMLIALFILHPKNVYIFKYYHPSSYLLARLAENRLDSQIYLIRGNGFFYNCCRYDNTTKAIVVLPSELHREELNRYIELGWFKKKAMEIWGHEEIFVYSKIKKDSEFKYDIGLYSSGEWARIDGKFRTDDITGIKNYKYRNNSYYLLFEEILKKLSELKENLDVKIAIYLHPYERILLHGFNIYPPYYSFAINNGIYIDTEGESSIEKIYESRIGISVQSTIIVDRLILGLPGLMMPININPKFLPEEYRKYFFNDIKDFEKKLLKLIEEEKTNYENQKDKRSSRFF